MKKHQTIFIIWIIYTLLMIALCILSLVLINYVPSLILKIILWIIDIPFYLGLYLGINHLTFFNKKASGPNRFPHYFIRTMIGFFFKNKVNIEIDNEEIKKIKGSYLIILNHVTGIDVYSIIKLVPDGKFYVIANRNLLTMPIIGKLFSLAGLIPKRMFTADTETILASRRALKNPYPLIVFPEGRLSVDGVTNPNFENIGGFIKMMKVPAAIYQNQGGYYVKPKWRKKVYQTPFKLVPKLILYPEDYANLTGDELNQIVKQNLSINDYATVKNRHLFTQKDKAEGLHKVIYHCLKCHHNYEMDSISNTLFCKHCHEQYQINDDYGFNHPLVKNIPDYFKKIKDYERQNLNNLYLQIDVKVQIKNRFSKKIYRGIGQIILSKDGLTYVGKHGFVKPLSQLTVISFTANKKIETYYDDQLYSFYPLQNKEVCSRISLLADLLQELKSEAL